MEKSYLSKILPYVPAGLEEQLVRTDCNWALPNGFTYRSYEGGMDIFGQDPDVWVHVYFAYDGMHAAVIGPNGRMPIGILSALSLMEIADRIKLAHEMGVNALADFGRFEKEVNAIIGGREELAPIVWELFNLNMNNTVVNMGVWA